MKKLLLSLLLSIVPLFAQDVQIPNAGPYWTLARNASPGISGGTGLNNNYILSPSSSNSGFCMAIANAHASQSVTVLVGVFSTVDPSVSTYSNNTSKWGTVAVIPVVQGNLSTGFFYVPAVGGSKYTFQFSGSSTNGGPVTVTLVQTNVCNALLPLGAGQGPSGVPFLCTSFTGAITVASGTTTKIATIPISGTSARVHVCGYSVSIDGATVTSVKNLFVSGTGATCGTATTSVWGIQSGVTGSHYDLFASQGQLFSGANGQDLCYTDAGTTSGSVVNIAYAIF